MAVAPISFGNPQISQGIDFASMGQQLTQAMQQREKRAILDRVAQGGGDPRELIQAGLQTGDISFANLGQNILNKQQEQQRQAQQDARQLERDAATDKNNAAYLSIAQRGAARADDKTPEGFEVNPAGGLRPIAGGPKSPEYLQTAQNRNSKLPAGFEFAPDGTLRPMKGGPADPEYLRAKPDKQNAPSGYVWTDPSDPSKGMKAIPGGPGEKIDAEVAGRLGLAKNFLMQLPSIKERVAKGNATGAFDAAKAWAGVGEPGQIRRQIDSGAEALLRMLTGAGMNKEEAAEYTRRYKLSPTDSAATVLDKLGQLEGELNSVGETVGRGRGGWESIRTTGPTSQSREIPSGAIEALRGNPALKADFEAKYGAGTAAAVVR